jgi:mannose-6-phosphate isomerase-like protein (cupin superfamily)
MYRQFSKRIALFSLILSPVALAQVGASTTQQLTLEHRIAHTDPAKYRHLSAVHDGPGAMDFGALLGVDALDANLLFLHRGVIAPRSGIGQHFHNKCEEMFVVLDGEAQFTIDGRTSTLKAPAGAPDRMGHAHGIYNPTDKPVQWLNINVGLSKVYDAFNLGDPLLGGPVDLIPQFITMRLDPSLLKQVNNMNHGSGTVQYRRALQPAVFSTEWSYVDHLLIPAGSVVGPDAKADIAEVYYVLAGDGTVKVGSESAQIHDDDAIPIRLGESKSFANTGSGPLEVMIIGVAKDMATKDTLWATQPLH